MSHGLGPAILDMFCMHEVLVQVMSEHGLKSVLCAGNWISQEPRALAEAGLEVTALDLSRTAIELARTGGLGPGELGPLSDRALYRPGGGTEFIVGDILARSSLL